MKVKVKGLVFVGFAAAVFAQSAFATITPVPAEKKIVTSKYYVDSTFQEKEDKVKLTGTQTINDITSTQWESNDLYPSMNVLKGVKDKVNGISVVEAAGGYVDVSQSGDTYTLNVDSDKIDSTGAAIQASGTTDNGKLVTAGAVKAILDTDLTDSTNTATTVPTAAAVVTYAEAVANKATAIITSGDGQNNTNATGGDTAYPTTAAVYDFVTSQVGGAAYQRKLTSADIGTLYVGQYDGSASGDQSTWKQLSIADADNTGGTAALANTNYVAKTVSGGVYTVNLDAAQIADSIANDASQKLVTENAVYDLVAREGTGTGTTINGTNPSDSLVPTVKNVYDFVSGGYQPINNTATVKVSYNGGWSELTDGGSDYIDVARNSTSGNTEVTLTNLTAATTDFVAPIANDSANAATRAKLAKSGDVYDFVMAQTGGLAIPEMPDYCDTVVSQSGGYCALVYGAKDGGGTGLQWTIMAPDTMPTSQPEP